MNVVRTIKYKGVAFEKCNQTLTVSALHMFS